MSDFQRGFGSGLGGAVGNILGSIIPSSTSSTSSGTSSGTATATSQKQLSQAAIDKLVYDVLSSDTGLAALATGENLSGGYAASTKALLAQDFVTKLVGELANVTAPTITTQVQEAKQESKSTSKKKMSVICTHLYRIGLLDGGLYNHPKAVQHFLDIPATTVRGYHAWAIPFVSWLERNTWAAILIAPIVHSRYLQIVIGKRTLSGFLTITLGHPICRVIGKIAQVLEKGKEDKNGYVH